MNLQAPAIRGRCRRAMSRYRALPRNSVFRKQKNTVQRARHATDVLLALARRGTPLRPPTFPLLHRDKDYSGITDACMLLSPSLSMSCWHSMPV